MENKSIGGALVDVFDAGVSLVKSEITSLGRRVGDIAKAKGLGVVLLLAALVPLTLALIFLILFVYYGLIRLGLAPWSASLLIGVFSLIVTAGLIFVGLKKLGSDVPDSSDPTSNMSDIAKDDLKYGYTSAKTPATGTTGTGTTGTTAPAAGTPADHASGHAQTGHTTGGHAAPVAPAQPVKATQPAHGAGHEAHAPAVPKSGVAPQSTSTQGKPTGEPEKSGIVVSTHPTYQDDMKKEGY
ncbi:phage holin family protein [Deinococcus altitudinis]|uniref:phage holin family protein n=1 Tax=Deinococcus altitudinis TaxID=468914 RepID=UPI0038926041